MKGGEGEMWEWVWRSLLPGLISQCFLQQRFTLA